MNLKENTMTLSGSLCDLREHVARGYPRGRLRRALVRGVTLIEILIVLAIVGMIAGGVAVYAVPKFKESQVKSAKISAQDLQSIADGWRADNGNDCPTPARLKQEKQMSAGSSFICVITSASFMPSGLFNTIPSAAWSLCSQIRTTV